MLRASRLPIDWVTQRTLLGFLKLSVGKTPALLVGSVPLDCPKRPVNDRQATVSSFPYDWCFDLNSAVEPTKKLQSSMNVSMRAGDLHP